MFGFDLTIWKQQKQYLDNPWPSCWLEKAMFWKVLLLKKEEKRIPGIRYLYIYLYFLYNMQIYIICKYIYIYRHDYICIAIFGNAISWCLQFSLRFSWHSPFVHNKNPDLQMFPTKESITFYQGAFALQVPCNWIGKMVTTTRWDKKRQREKVIWCEKKVIANVHL